MRPHLRLPLALAAALVGASPSALAKDPKLPGDVRWWTEIGDQTGGFTGSIDGGDDFGRSITLLGDLDDDGVDDLAVGAHLDDDGGDRRGALYVLFMNQNGTIKAHQKISDTAGGFSGALDNVDHFGSGLAGLGDLDGDGVEDLAVGAPLDDDGGSQRGAVWILFLNTNGTVKGHQKISDFSGSFGGALLNNSWFGTSVANLGDLDGDDVVDLAVGAPFHLNQGAFWVLLMNSNGTVKAETYVTGFNGGFSGPVGNLGAFGWDVTGLGDLDGDGVEDMAVGARRFCDGGGPPCNLGAVWVLLLNANGTVKGQQKIADGEGGFVGPLNPYAFFGSSVTGLGDLDGDGVPDLAVGSPQDDDGGPKGDENANLGAVFVLFLNEDGSVKTQNKISQTSGNFDGGLFPGDDFSTGLESIGDFDGDGVVDLASSAIDRPATSGTQDGTVFLLFLGNPLSVAVDQAPDGQVGLAYDADLGFGGGTPPYTAEVVKGALPPGLSLSDEGTISGAPTKKGKRKFTIRLADAAAQETKQKVKLVVKAPVRLVTDSLGKAKHGYPFQKKLKAKGGQEPYAFEVVDGSLPNGVGFEESDSDKISGVPTEVGEFLVTLRVTDDMGATDEEVVALKVKSTLKVKTKELPKAKVGKPYDEPIVVKGGVPGYAFEVIDGALPDGVALVVDEGPKGEVQLAGTPTEDGKFTFTIRVTDDSGETAERALKLKVKGT